MMNYTVQVNKNESQNHSRFLSLNDTSSFESSSSSKDKSKLKKPPLKTLTSTPAAQVTNYPSNARLNLSPITKGPGTLVASPRSSTFVKKVADPPEKKKSKLPPEKDDILESILAKLIKKTTLKKKENVNPSNSLTISKFAKTVEGKSGGIENVGKITKVNQQAGSQKKLKEQNFKITGIPSKSAPSRSPDESPSPGPAESSSPSPDESSSPGPAESTSPSPDELPMHSPTKKVAQRNAPSRSFQLPLRDPGRSSLISYELPKRSPRSPLRANDSPKRRANDSPKRRAADSPKRRAADSPKRRAADSPKRGASASDKPKNNTVHVNLEIKKNKRKSGIPTKISTSKGAKRLKPGMKALMDIKRFQKSTDLLLAKLPFSRVVKEIMQECTRGEGFRIQASALEALQEAAEAHLVSVYEKANLLAIHSHRVTVMVRDLRLLKMLNLT